MRSSTKKRQYHHGNLRAALIEAGIELIASEGARALTLREIGDRLGVSRMAAYRHFAGRAELIAAIREAGFQQFGDALARARDGAGEKFEARMTALAKAYVRFAREHPAYFAVLFGSDSLRDKPFRSEAGERSFSILEQTIREGQKDGDVRAGDSRLLACAAWAIVHGISALELERTFAGDMAAEDFVEACSGLILTGLDATTASRIASQQISGTDPSQRP